MKVAFVGCDNGTSGSIGIITVDYEKGDVQSRFFLTPVKKELSYQKSKKAYRTRLDYPEMHRILKELKESTDRIILCMERPMINATRMVASLSAIACLEAMLILLEDLDIPFSYIGSKEWQKNLLPAGIKGSDEQKKASMNVGCRLFPEHKELIQKHKDADGLLIAEHLHRKGV